MERKCAADVQFGELYQMFLKEYEDLHHMTEATPPAKGQPVCYLPHHGVLRESSATTKLRVVFNGSQPLRNGKSLNSNCCSLAPIYCRSWPTSFSGGDGIDS